MMFTDTFHQSFRYSSSFVSLLSYVLLAFDLVMNLVHGSLGLFR